MSDRPIQCSECKKTARVTYKELANGKCTSTEMCSTCPVLEKKLHGISNVEDQETGKQKAPKLCCALCFTTAEAIEMGSPLGCNHCYTVFEDLLKEKLSAESSFKTHQGKSPTQSITIPLSSQFITLNEALNSALKKEEYEQAAWLRDQIQALKEQTNGRKKPST